MTFVGIDASELNRLGVDLGRAAVRVGARTAAVIRKTAFDIEADAQALAPVDTGNLRSSVSTSFEGDGRSLSLAAEIGPTAEYGDYVERGTSRMAGQPYMAPAFDRRAPLMQAAILALAAEDLL